MSKLHADDQKSLLKRVYLLAGVLVLLFLAFFPFSDFFRMPYDDLVLNSLHLPATLLFYHICRAFIASKKQVVLIVLIGIFGVEILQHYIGRQASWSDIWNGVAGLCLGLYSNQFFFIFASVCWALTYGILIFLRHDIIVHYPNIGDFRYTSIRANWQPTKPNQEASSAILFIQKNPDATPNEEQMLMQIVQLQPGFWGANFRLKHTQTHPVYFADICLRTELGETINMRIDDRKRPTYTERVNLKITTTDSLQCHSIALQPALQQLKNKGTQFQTDHIHNIAIFMDPKAKSTWFEIESVIFSEYDNKKVRSKK